MKRTELKPPGDAGPHRQQRHRRDNSWEADIAADEKELRTLDRQKQNLVRLYSKMLVSEAEVEKQLAGVRAQQ